VLIPKRGDKTTWCGREINILEGIVASQVKRWE